MDSCESISVALSVELHMEVVLGFEFAHHVLDVFHATGSSSHGLSGEVSVTAGSVPVGEQFWFERDNKGELLGTSH